MSWLTLTVGDLVDGGTADIQTGPFGTQLKASDYVEDGTPVINVRNIGFGRLKTGKLEFVNEETIERLSSHLLEQSDIVFGRKGAVDRHLFVNEEQAHWIQGSDCIRLRFLSVDVVPRFVSYAFLTDAHQKWMLAQSGNKATMASLNHDIIKRITFRVPGPAAQERIVNTLSAYDDLTENNLRRMALLEEMPRQLYREWFVRLRFPGHEHTSVVDGVREGWERKPLSVVCAEGDGIQTGPFGSQLHQSDYSDDGVPVVMPQDIINYRMSVEKVARVPESMAEQLLRHRMKPGDTVYGRRGDIGRRAFVSPRQAGWLCGTGCLRIRPNAQVVSPRFLFDTLGAPDTAGTIANRAKGATMLNLNATILKSVPVLVPRRNFQDHYAQQVDPVYEMIEVLAEQNQGLLAAQDLLLPRVMSGEIVV